MISSCSWSSGPLWVQVAVEIWKLTRILFWCLKRPSKHEQQNWWGKHALCSVPCVSWIQLIQTHFCLRLLSVSCAGFFCVLFWLHCNHGNHITNCGGLNNCLYHFFSSFLAVKPWCCQVLPFKVLAWINAQKIMLESPVCGFFVFFFNLYGESLTFMTKTLEVHNTLYLTHSHKNGF